MSGGTHDGDVEMVDGTRGAFPAGMVVDASACDPDDLSPCGGVAVTVSHDLPWTDLVATAVGAAWPGLEALAGQRGTVAEIVRTNPTAHGQTVSGVVASVRTWDRQRDAQKTFARSDCGFAPHTSRFQERLPDGHLRYEILDVALLFKQGDLTAPVTDAGLASLLGVDVGERVPLGAVRDVVTR